MLTSKRESLFQFDFIFLIVTNSHTCVYVKHGKLGNYETLHGKIREGFTNFEMLKRKKTVGEIKQKEMGRQPPKSLLTINSPH